MKISATVNTREPILEPPRVYPVNCQAEKHSPDTQEQIAIDYGWLLTDLVQEFRSMREQEQHFSQAVQQKKQ